VELEAILIAALPNTLLQVRHISDLRAFLTLCQPEDSTLAGFDSHPNDRTH
jgi:hypothetical protein